MLKHIMPHYLFLVIAIISEVIATTALKSIDGFSRWGPIAVAVVGYVLAIVFLMLCLRSFPVGVAYALWSGVGMVLIAFLGYVVHDQKLDVAGMAGIGLIIAGVLVLNLFSQAKIH